MADTNSEIMVLTEEGLRTLTKEIFAVVNARIDERIVTEISDSSDNKHSASAASVNEAIKRVNHILPLVIADGDITKAAITPDNKTMYIVRKSADAKEGVPYIYIDGVGYVATCSLSSIEDQKDLKAIPNDVIKSAVVLAASDTDPDSTSSGSGEDSGSGETPDSGSGSGTIDGDGEVDDDL